MFQITDNVTHCQTIKVKASILYITHRICTAKKDPRGYMGYYIQGFQKYLRGEFSLFLHKNQILQPIGWLHNFDG